jgi:hypothetical protein
MSFLSSVLPMKFKFLFASPCFIWLLAHSLNANAMNRIASEADRQAYGEYISLGDLIIDTPTKIGNGKAEVIYYFMKKQWPGLREGGTIWIDGKKLGFVDMIKFCNTSAALSPWNIESACIRNIPDTQVKAGSFSVSGLKNIEINGECAQFPGLNEWPETRKFLTGSFGIHAVNSIFGGHGIEVAVQDGGSIKLKGFEIQHGFSGIRINGGNYDITVEAIEISNFYIHDTGDGEGLYLGATHKPPLAKLKNLKIFNAIITRTAAEGLQLQHLVGGADVHNVTIRSADVRWLHEFGPGQDTGIQWSVDAGENKLHNVIVDGFGSVGLVPFGSNEKPTGGVSLVSDVLFNDGHDLGMYLHKSGSYGIQWVFENLYFRGFNNEYYSCTGSTFRNYMISKRFGKDEYIFKSVIHDNTKSKVFEKKDSVTVVKMVESKLPPPEYINSGFSEPASKIRQWYAYLGGYFPASQSGTVKVMVEWRQGDIAIETNDEYGFYKCIQTHEGSNLRPSKSPYFQKLTWDANGIRSDSRDWQPNLPQSNFPPDDLRLKKDNYWREKGFGYLESSHVDITSDRKKP